MRKRSVGRPKLREGRHRLSLTVRIRPDLRQWLDDYCERTGVSRSDAVDEALDMLSYSSAVTMQHD